MIEIICVSITGLCTIVCACVGALISRSNKLNEERQKQQILLLKMLDANMQLTTATANAVLGKKNNGNVEKAYESADSASSEYHCFLEQTALKKML